MSKNFICLYLAAVQQNKLGAKNIQMYLASFIRQFIRQYHITLYFVVGSTSSGAAFVIAPNLGAKLS
jgi:hypothetical protein